ncbi:PREDICTED: E3 ubiquitin-protein ligase MIB2-like [Amphimedon queenslandica]|uniref:RING-type E3 ubiquitin transferase n=1 Tax=Amphimedon queenslandica TaxID=400682 RepID=A0A1X7VGN7_AMPQE|nr:PREDICTED: E3 ubiquitin-protein ligase MIB2-like [Amphimedon queenslandica]|eukprot:XP_019848978.1 PREDICTED: E3 ubiquitin-protein ligase MIB2-like [Amphimedon queenslandica]
MDVKIGVRVVRGPDWKWGQQDGGEGYVGTVVEVRTADTTPASSEDGGSSLVTPRAVLVQWDNGSRCNYRCGIDGKYDLLLYDNAPAAVRHPNITCDSCRQNGIEGLRYKCVNCFDFDLCFSCYMSSKHSMEHKFILQEAPEAPFVNLPLRCDSSRLVAKGLFKDAEVTRGYDWLWGDQDGGIGNIGHLVTIKGWEKDTFRSVAEVEWKKGGKKNVYRVGHKGKVDIKAITPGEYGYYFPDHLPVLGKKIQEKDIYDTKATPAGKGSDGGIAAGDQVRVQLDVDVFKALQEGHGGWNDDMAQLIEQMGTVHNVLDSGDIRVRYPNNRTWTLNPASLTKVTQFAVGDVIKIIDDIALVHDLQEDHGGWVDDMALTLGQAGRVVRVFPSGDLRVSVNGRSWTFNPLCMNAAPDENPPEAPPDTDNGLLDGLGGGVDIETQLRLLTLLENPAVVVAAAAANDTNALREFLVKHPSEVNAKAAGKAALHCAAVAGHIEIIKCLLEFKANLEIEDEDGDRPLHLCAYGDEEEAAQLLIDNGADVNARSKRGMTALNLSAIKGHTSILKVLIRDQNIDLSAADSEGNTPLHCAVLAQKLEAIVLLLDAGGDPSLVNFRLFTPLHEAARIGFLPGVDLFIKRNPECVNLKKDDGLTPLHLACLNNHLDVATTIAECEACDIDSVANDESTPLHYAVHQGHVRVVERLIGFGAKLNVQDHDGDTPLHMAMVRQTDGALGSDTPQLKKLNDSIEVSEEATDRVSILQACFLIQQGADPYILNHKGNAPLSICSPEKAVSITQFIDDKDKYPSTFHGSLKRVQPTTHPLAILPAPQTPSNGHSATANDTSPAPVKATPPVLPPVPSSSFIECIICEKEVTLRLLPCRHEVLCTECTQRAKKCPECKVKLEGIEEISPKCLMCEEEVATVTLEPCQHKFCPDCCKRMKRCSECRKTIEKKIGLTDTSTTDTAVISPVGAGPPGSSAPISATSPSICEICCENPRNTVLTCGHQFCSNCSQKVDQCPICRKVIMHRIQLFQ